MTGKATDYSITPVSFYKFVCNDVEIKSTYVGHTVNFTKRKSHHKNACKSNTYKNHNCKIYQTIRDNGGWSNWRMIEIEKRLVKDVREAERIEQEFMDKLQSNLNMCKSYNPNYYISQEYKEELAIQNKEYYQEHKAYYKAYSKEHKEEIDIIHKAYVEEHKEDIAIYMKAYQQEHKEKIAIYNKAYLQRKKEQKLMSQEDKRY